jgi:hypothetical protein
MWFDSISRVEDVLHLLVFLLGRGKDHVDVNQLLVLVPFAVALPSLVSLGSREEIALSAAFFFYLHFPHSLIDDVELVGPVSGIKPRTHVESVVIAGLGIIEESWWQGGHFVSVVSIVRKESFDFGGQLLKTAIGFLIDHSVEHRYWTQSFHLPQPSEHAKLSISQTHVLLISLGDLPLIQRA